MGEAVTPIEDPLIANIATVRARIAAACAEADRPADEVRLVAVTKYVDAQVVARLAAAGVKDVGENRVPALLAKRASVGDAVRWHMIGHLQRNKVRRVLPAIDWLHAGDGLRLLQVLDTEIARAERDPLPVLLQINVSGEGTKGGFAPAELEASWEEIRTLEHVSVRGLMTMAPFVDDPEQVRPVFRTLREIRDEACARGYLEGRELSMGMSGDFEVAVQEGATMVRIGRILYASMV